MGVWNAVLYVLSFAVTEYEKYNERKQQKKRQAERDELENDVGVWWTDHFSGLPERTDKTKTDAPDSKPAGDKRINML